MWRTGWRAPPRRGGAAPWAGRLAPPRSYSLSFSRAPCAVAAAPRSSPPACAGPGQRWRGGGAVARWRRGGGVTVARGRRRDGAGAVRWRRGGGSDSAEGGTLGDRTLASWRGSVKGRGARCVATCVLLRLWPGWRAFFRAESRSPFCLVKKRSDLAASSAALVIVCRLTPPPALTLRVCAVAGRPRLGTQPRISGRSESSSRLGAQVAKPPGCSVDTPPSSPPSASPITVPRSGGIRASGGRRAQWQSRDVVSVRAVAMRLLAGDRARVRVSVRHAEATSAPEAQAGAALPNVGVLVENELFEVLNKNELKNPRSWPET